MTLSHQNFKKWPLAAVAMAMACSVSAQVGTPGSTTPGTAPATSPATTTGPSVTNPTDTLQQNPGTTTGTPGSLDTRQQSPTTGATGMGPGTTGTQSMDHNRSTATSGSPASTRSGWMGSRPMYGQGEGNYSLIPYSTGGYVGFNAGQPKFDTPCVAGFSCTNHTTSYKLYTGGMFNQYVGGELAYVDMGRVHRAGGRTSAHGINLSVVGRVPLGGFNLFGKAGTTYGRTKTNTASDAIATGKEKGWGGSYGVGVGFDLTRASSIVLEWERHEFRFSGLGRQSVDSTTLGYVHRF
jgi:OOP family OmpA-OmpF porin